MAPVVASTLSLEACISVAVVVPIVVETIIPISVPEVGQPVTRATGFSARELSPSPSPAKRSQGDSPSTHNPSTYVEEGPSKRARLSEAREKEVLTPFFQLPTILTFRVPSTIEEFVASMNYENMDFVWGLSATNRRVRFAYFFLYSI